MNIPVWGKKLGCWLLKGELAERDAMLNRLTSMVQQFGLDNVRVKVSQENETHTYLLRLQVTLPHAPYSLRADPKLTDGELRDVYLATLSFLREHCRVALLGCPYFATLRSKQQDQQETPDGNEKENKS